MNPVLTAGRDGRIGVAPGGLDHLGASGGCGSAGHDGAGLLERIPREAAKTPSLGLVGRTVAEVERELILDTLGHCLGNRTQAARILGISIRTLRNKLKEYGDAGVSVPAPQAGVGAAYAA